MTVGELRQRMTNQEFVQWAAYWALEAQRRELAAKGR